MQDDAYVVLMFKFLQMPSWKFFSAHTFFQIGEGLCSISESQELVQIRECTKDEMVCPEGWKWMGNWELKPEKSKDREGIYIYIQYVRMA